MEMREDDVGRIVVGYLCSIERRCVRNNILGIEYKWSERGQIEEHSYI